MLIAIMSDSHDHLHHIKKAMDICVKKKVNAIIHCGDFVAPFSLKELARPEIPLFGVFGNNDGDQVKMTEYTRTILPHVRLSRIMGSKNFDNKKIAFTHYFEQAKPLAESGRYDLVCFGHSHTWYCKEVNNTLLLNPGEIMGKEGSPGFALYDTQTNRISEVKI